jgi:glycosyltransferase involved in cell wall biosynthesis
MISFLIPAYNEASSITQTIRGLQAVMDQTSLVYEILVIDDGSHDDTAQLAGETGVKVIRHPTNRGYGRALKTGMVHAQYDWCAIVDADGSYPLEGFPALLEYIPAFDMVVGARTGSHFWGSPAKRFGRYILHRLVAFVIGQKIPDANSGMRIFRKSIALAHAKRISSGFSFTVTLTLAMFMEEHFVKYMPIDYHPRVGASKVKIGMDSLRVMQILTMAILYYNPLKLFLVMCFLSLGVGLLAALILLAISSLTTAILSFALSLQFAVLMGGLGFLAEAIRLHRIGIRSQNDPPPS